MMKIGFLLELVNLFRIFVLIFIAALARKVYLRHNIGVGSLKHIFGGKWRRGVRTPRHGSASKKVIRYCL